MYANIWNIHCLGGRFQLGAVFSPGLSPARGCFRPGAVSSQGLFPARGCFQPGALSSQGVVSSLGLVTVFRGLFLTRVCSSDWWFPLKALFLPKARSSDRLVAHCFHFDYRGTPPPAILLRRYKGKGLLLGARVC